MSITPQMRDSLFQEFIDRSSKINIFPNVASNRAIDQSIDDLMMEAPRVQQIFQNIRRTLNDPLKNLIDLIRECPFSQLKRTYEQFITLFEVDIATENLIICYLLENNMPLVLGLLFEERKHEIQTRFLSNNNLTSFLFSSIGASHDPKMLAFWNENDCISNLITHSMSHLQLFLVGFFSKDPHQNFEMPLRLIEHIFRNIDSLPIECQSTLRNFLKSTSQPKRTFFNFMLQTYLPEMRQHTNLLIKAINNIREISLEELLLLHYYQKKYQFNTTTFLMKILRSRETDEELEKIGNFIELRRPLLCYLRASNSSTNKTLLKALTDQRS